MLIILKIDDLLIINFYLFNFNNLVYNYCFFDDLLFFFKYLILYIILNFDLLLII